MKQAANASPMQKRGMPAPSDAVITNWTGKAPLEVGMTEKRWSVEVKIVTDT